MAKTFILWMCFTIFSVPVWAISAKEWCEKVGLMSPDVRSEFLVDDFLAAPLYALGLRRQTLIKLCRLKVGRVVELVTADPRSLQNLDPRTIDEIVEVLNEKRLSVGMNINVRSIPKLDLRRDIETLNVSERDLLILREKGFLTLKDLKDTNQAYLEVKTGLGAPGAKRVQVAMMKLGMCLEE